MRQSTVVPLLFVSIFVIVSAQDTCEPGYYKNPNYVGCTHCSSCTLESGAACTVKCGCTATSQCQPPMAFCGIYTPYQSADRQICSPCSSSCFGSDSAYERLLPGDTSVPGSADCPTSCLCTAHSQCPTGSFCGRSSSSGAPNVCRKCDSCADALAVDGSCPGTNCAATIQCRSNDACNVGNASGSSWCTAGLQCQSCSSSCYTAKRSRAQYAEYTFASLTGMCPQSCCGWTTMHEYPTENPQFMYGLCDSEKYTGFAAFWTDDVTKAYPTTRAGAQRDGWAACSVTIDENADGFPRKVPIFECNYIKSCEEGPRMIVVFAEEGAVTHTLRAQNGTVSTKSDTCGLAQILLIVIVCTVVGGIVFCACVCGVCFGLYKLCSSATAPPPQTVVVASQQPVVGIPVQSQEMAAVGVSKA